MRASSSRVLFLVGGEMLVQVLEQIEPAALLFVADGVGRQHIENGRSAIAQQRTLKRRWKKTGTPVLGAAEDFARVRHDDEAREILVRGTKRVRYPGAHRGPAGENGPGIHLAHRADVIQTIGPAASEHGHFVNVFCDLRDTSRTPRFRSGHIA